MKLVVVDVSLLPRPKYVAQYAVLKDKTCEEIMAFAAAHPKVFVFPFMTKSVEECPDCTALSDGGSAMDYVVLPMYIGNFKPEDQAVFMVKTVRCALSLADELKKVL